MAYFMSCIFLFIFFAPEMMLMVPSLVGEAVPFPPFGNTRSELEKL